MSTSGSGGRKGLSLSPAASRKPSNVSSSTSQYARATLGVGSPTPRHGSMPGTSEGARSANPARASFSKGLDPSDPSTWTSRHSFDERPRAASETIQRANVPVIRAPDDTESSVGTGKTSINLDGANVAQEKSTIAKAQDSGLAGTSDSQKPPEVPTVGPVSPDNKNTTLFSPKEPGLGVPGSDESDNRRFSNQSTSFSSVTTDSDRIGRVSQDSERDNENALQESSEDDRSSSEQDEQDEREQGSPSLERGRKRKTGRPLKSPEASPKPEIRIEDTSDTKQESPTPPDGSGKLSETKPTKVAPKSGVARAPSPAALSAFGDDDAELQRAKELVLRTSPIDETVRDRTVKMVIRGEWETFQDNDDEQTEFRHEPRLYLVCSDLSSEASHALEWTVGTLLKDGDTLLIINAIEAENAPKHKPDEEPSAEIKMESAKAASEATATMESLTKQTTNQEASKLSLKPRLASLKDGRSLSQGSPRPGSRGGSRTPSRRDTVRLQAVEKLEQDFLKFVRKTTLQVRMMIEVLHCRSPRHLILNAIDELEPTLVVVGTRGQSSIQGVMMGSFSNYLVTKSSIPVMVARRRLKKPHHAKVSSQQIRMTNNLVPMGVKSKRKSLTQARID